MVRRYVKMFFARFFSRQPDRTFRQLWHIPFDTFLWHIPFDTFLWTPLSFDTFLWWFCSIISLFIFFYTIFYTGNAHQLWSAIFLYFLVLFVGGLWIFHTWLACTNMTSYEFMRSDRIDYLQGTKDFDLPYS